MEPIYIIDASGYLFRSYYAITPMTNPRGESTNALFGFIRSIMKLFKDFNPKYIVAVFDGPHNSIKREKIYPKYKSHRAECPPDLGHQIEWAKQFCSLMGISILDIPEVEADDTMGSVAVLDEFQEHPVYLCTSDKDLCQLVSKKIQVLNTHKDNQILGPEEVKQNFGVHPDQMIDYLAIVGDSSDNIPGIPGFGPKTATLLLQEYGNLETLLENPQTLKEKKRAVVLENSEQAKVSKLLVTIDTKVDVPKEKDFYLKKEVDLSQLRKFYLDMGFHSLLGELGNDQSKETTSYNLINSREELKELIEFLSKEKEICIDTVTTDIHPFHAELVGIGFCIKPKEAFYVPARGTIPLKEVLDIIRPIFENSTIAFFGHHIKYDMHVLNNHGIEISNLCFDTMIASYILNAHQRQHNLNALILEYFNKVKTPIDSLLGKGKKAISMAEVSIEHACEYCCEDVDFTVRLKIGQEKELVKRNLKKLFESIELPLIKILAKMERKGIYIDASYMKQMSLQVSEVLKQLEHEIYRFAGEEFNLNSPKQLSVILFEKLGIPPPKKIASGFSTEAGVLELLREESEIVEKILQYRTLSKLKSTYLDALPKEIHPETHRIHCTFNQSVAATGRLSSQNPNLQNIPIRSEIGKRIRAAFQPEWKDWSYLAADYSQIELRLLAHFSEDPKLQEAFQNHQDVHIHTASILFGAPLDLVTPQMRRQAKAVNFGVIYGQQAFGLSKELHISVKDAASFIEMYFQRYKKVKTFVEACKTQAKQTGKTVTLTGRERALPEIYNKNAMIRQAAERLAINTPLQGSAADLIKLSMLEVDKRLTDKKMRSSMILQIHDELIFEAPHEELPTLQKMVKDVMENVWQLKVPLIVDISIGKNWEEC